jgi:hypothetical protein
MICSNTSMLMIADFSIYINILSPDSDIKSGIVIDDIDGF